jgi:hypothetical protein
LVQHRANGLKMLKPTPTLTIICLISSKDFLIQLLSVLPAKFRGALSSASLSDMSDPLYALLALVPLLILSGHSRIGFHNLYQKSIPLQKAGLGLTLFIMLAHQVSMIVAAPLYTGLGVLVSANLNFLCLVLITINWRRLYSQTQATEG